MKITSKRIRNEEKRIRFGAKRIRNGKQTLTKKQGSIAVKHRFLAKMPADRVYRFTTIPYRT
ncbi:hypothetical protein DCO56_28160 [Sphingobacterium athyrii]|uniref:Uncharacterized protein n=1 Tax=Sphingobacterium athyrii TaxID=2152717 RepID=A0A363NK00_9SPHI|nr:hypothetical protein DCO56_28160 [Sphingobacterium athyrii]